VDLLRTGAARFRRLLGGVSRNHQCHRLQLPPPRARHGDSISCLTSADKFNRRGGTAAINVLASSRQAACPREPVPPRAAA